MSTDLTQEELNKKAEQIKQAEVELAKEGLEEEKKEYANRFKSTIGAAYISGFCSAKGYPNQVALQLLRRFETDSEVEFDGNNPRELMVELDSITTAYATANQIIS